MTTLDWPKLQPADRETLRAELRSLIEQIVNEDMNALDTLDDQFARMTAALLALLNEHVPTPDGRCPRCPTASVCQVLETVHHYLNQPLALIWWHLHQQRDVPMSIDQIGAWLAASETPRPW